MQTPTPSSSPLTSRTFGCWERRRPAGESAFCIDPNVGSWERRRLAGESGLCLDPNRRRDAGAPSPARAFSLIELLTAVSIMVVIIFALYAMFAQTQKALRANITQVDVLESGRAAAEMIGRDLEQLAASNQTNCTNLYARCAVEIMDESTPPKVLRFLDRLPLVHKDTDGKTNLRTNILDEVFFLTHATNRWIGNGYRVVRAEDGVGTLCRFREQGNVSWQNPVDLMRRFFTNQFTSVMRAGGGYTSTETNRIVEGVVHFRITAYDANGLRLGWETTNKFPNYSRLASLDGNNGVLSFPRTTARSLADATIILGQEKRSPTDTRLTFIYDALPSYLELELGVLEPASLRHYQSLRVAPKSAKRFLESETASKVHLFRQRIPIRTAQQ